MSDSDLTPTFALFLLIFILILSVSHSLKIFQCSVGDHYLSEDLFGLKSIYPVSYEELDSLMKNCATLS
jgi:hypothetical protein